jgi:hypothetical protein
MLGEESMTRSNLILIFQNSAFSLSLLLLSCTSTATKSERTIATNSTYTPCLADPERQKSRSFELQSIVEADQLDRKPPIDWTIVAPRDEKRAMRVAEIFAEGCFKGADDYAAAALIFQHGSVPDHYYQTYLWSKHAFELGKSNQSNMMANAIDRYLINIGQKQLFAAQSFRNGPNGCHCLGEVEIDFPDDLRIKFTGKSLAERIRELKEENKLNPTCASILYCPTNLKPAAKGMFPGIW